jgi:hypothetical protein
MHEHRHKQQLAAKLAEQSLSVLQFKSASARARVDRMVVWQMPVTQALREYDCSRLSTSSSTSSTSTSTSTSSDEEQGEQEGGSHDENGGGGGGAREVPGSQAKSGKERESLRFRRRRDIDIEKLRRTFAVYSGEITQVRKDSVADGSSVGGQSWRGLFWDLEEEGSVPQSPSSKAERLKSRARKIPQVCVCVPVCVCVCVYICI